MSNIQVDTRTQALFPDGMNDSFIIKNNGPYAVYVDSDSAVNNSSLRIPPTGIMPWDSQRPLWIVGDASIPSGRFSNVVITRNSQPVAFNNDQDTVLYSSGQQVADPNIFVGTPVTTPIIDCSAWQTLRILTQVQPSRIKNQGDEYAIGDQISLSIRWFDSLQNDLGVDSYLIPYPSNEDPKLAAVSYSLATFTGITPQARVAIPVKGTYFQAKAVLQNTDLALFTVIGSTRDEATRTCFTKYDTLPHTGGGLATIPEFQALTSDSWSCAAIPSLSWPALYLPGITGTVNLSFVSGFTITTAGLMRFRSPFGGSAVPLWPDVSIPAVAAGVVTQVTINLPVDQPTKLTFPTIPQKAGPVNLDAWSLKLQYL